MKSEYTKLDYEEELEVISDMIDEYKYNFETSDNESFWKTKKFDFNKYKEYYYYTVKIDDKVGYVKYTDVKIIENSINTDNKGEKRKYYIYEDEYLFSGPRLSFQQTNETKKIPKGEIVDTNTYSQIGNGLWLYVTYNGQSGWILERYFNSVNYPYNNIYYGNAVKIIEKSGKINTGNNIINLNKYALSDEVEEITKIPTNNELIYDYEVADYDAVYLHVKYNNTEGWIKEIEASNCDDKKDDGNLYAAPNNGELVICN